MLLVQVASALTISQTGYMIRDGLQKCLSARNSRMAIELPPGIMFESTGQPSKRVTDSRKDTIYLSDRQLCKFVSGLIPEYLTRARVFTSKKNARYCKGSQLPRDAKFGFCSAWCPELGVENQVDMILLTGALDEKGAASVRAASERLGQDTVILLLNSRLKGLAAYTASDVDNVGFTPAFSLSPVHKDDDKKFAYRVYPQDWIVAEPRPTFIPGQTKDFTLFQGPELPPADFFRGSNEKATKRRLN